VDAAACVAGEVSVGVAEAVAMGMGEAALIGVAGGVAIGVVETVAMGVAEGVAMAVVGVVATGAAEGVAIGAVEGVATGAAGEAARGTTENNSKSVTIIGIDGTEDPVDCGCAMLRGIPKAEVRVKTITIRTAQSHFPDCGGRKSMRNSPSGHPIRLLDALGENE
jgi:hypothetical protein